MVFIRQDNSASALQNSPAKLLPKAASSSSDQEGAVHCYWVINLWTDGVSLCVLSLYCLDLPGLTVQTATDYRALQHHPATPHSLQGVGNQFYYYWTPGYDISTYLYWGVGIMAQSSPSMTILSILFSDVKYGVVVYIIL